MCSSQHGGPAQRVPDDDGRRSIVLPQVIRSANQILDIRGEVGVLELPLGGAEPREVEPQHGDTKRGQGRRDATGCEDIFRAGEAVSEERIGANTWCWHVQPRGQLMTEAARKGHADRTIVHGGLQSDSLLVSIARRRSYASRRDSSVVR